MTPLSAFRTLNGGRFFTAKAGRYWIEAGRNGAPRKTQKRRNSMQQIREKAMIMDARAMDRALLRIAHEIIERNRSIESVALIGIHRRGVPLAERIAANIEMVEGVRVPLGMIDITMYRDDLSELSQHPVIRKTDIPFEVTGRAIVMVDDVIFTGRTVRAAMDAIMDLGRPKCLQLAALIDRGHREFPIRPDFVGKNVPTSHWEVVSVGISGIDEEDCVKIYERKE